jgi:hypothetical protein
LCFSAVTYHGQFNAACYFIKFGAVNHSVSAVFLHLEQINKLKAESQKTKPRLANHDHQVLIQTEPDDNVKDSTLKLAGVGNGAIISWVV